MAPLAGEHILTVLSTVAVQVCADTTPADAKRKDAARKTRSEITGAPFEKQKIKLCRRLSRHRATTETCDIAPPQEAPNCSSKLGEHPLPQGCPIPISYFDKQPAERDSAFLPTALLLRAIPELVAFMAEEARMASNGGSAAVNFRAPEVNPCVGRCCCVRLHYL